MYININVADTKHCMVLQEHDNASTADQAAKWEEQRQVSRYAANLPQLEAGLGRHGRQIPSDPSLWVCDETGVKENLWLNLSTGFIGSGRQVCITPVIFAVCGRDVVARRQLLGYFLA